MTETTITNTGCSTHRGRVALAVGYQWLYNSANSLAFKVAGNVSAATLSGAAMGMPPSMLVSRTLSTPRQTTHYIECGPSDGPLMIFLHGWPSISLMWRAQMDAFAGDGWHCVAPDLRGFGGSFAPAA